MIDTESISEIFYLLNFFSNTRSEQWNLVPHYFPPAWVRTASCECNVYNSIYFLSCIFAGSIEDTFPTFYDLENDFSAILQDEIKPLIDDWMTQYNDSIFEMEEVSNASKIWLVLSRLCKISLSYEDFNKYHINELSFEYFLNKYTSPYDPV
jgi:hypothetical protein